MHFSAAGFAVLFNHDLPWNPMDMEQCIGRIHRCGQQHTAHVYTIGVSAKGERSAHTWPTA